MDTLKSIFFALPGVVAFLFAALALAVIYVDELQARLKNHRVLRYALAVLVIAVGGAAFLADRVQHDQEQQHLEQKITEAESSTASKTAIDLTAPIAERVATETTSKVTKQLNRDYGDVIFDLRKQIADLRHVNETDVRLAYAPAVDLVYVGDRLQLWNRGKTTLTLWGNKYGDDPRNMDGPVQISTGAFEYFLTDKLQSRILQALGQNASEHVPLEMYVTTADKKKYVIHGELFEIVKDGAITIHTNNHGIERTDW